MRDALCHVRLSLDLPYVFPSKATRWLASRCDAQPEPLQPRQDGCGEIRQFCEIIDKVERQAIETRGLQPGEFLGDSVWSTNDTVGAACQGPPLYRVCAATPQQALRVGPRAGIALVHVGEISQRSPVGVIDDVLDVVIGFLLGRSADDANGRPDLDVAPTLTRQPFRLSDALNTGLGCVDAIEVHVRVTDRELASGR